MHVGAQKFDVIAYRLGNLTIDPVQRQQRLGKLVLLEVNACQAECGIIANGVVDRGFEHGLDRPSRAMVHAVTQLEIAERETGIVDVRVKRVELGLVDRGVLLDLGVEPLERLEVQALVGVIQRLAE
nr:hypothetical protein [Gammaproteobacteria bacterium]